MEQKKRRKNRTRITKNMPKWKTSIIKETKTEDDHDMWLEEHITNGTKDSLSWTQ